MRWLLTFGMRPTTLQLARGSTRVLVQSSSLMTSHCAHGTPIKSRGYLGRVWDVSTPWTPHARYYPLEVRSINSPRAGGTWWHLGGPDCIVQIDNTAWHWQFLEVLSVCFQHASLASGCLRQRGAVYNGSTCYAVVLCADHLGGRCIWITFSCFHIWVVAGIRCCKRPHSTKFRFDVIYYLETFGVVMIWKTTLSPRLNSAACKWALAWCQGL